MIVIHKVSLKPLKPWELIHVGGANNVAANVKAKYLVLWKADAVRRNGVWHYVLVFDARETLAASPLAQAVYHSRDLKYKDGVDWKSWLGDQWQIIDDVQRWELLKGEQPGELGHVAIMDVKPIRPWQATAMGV